MWYKNSFRRHLCDMHIDDWDDSFLSKFSAEDYFEHLKKTNVSAAMIYYQSHVGLCYYPTKTARMHKAFIGREDEMRRLTEMCREAGIAVSGYYSLNYNVWAHDTHPEWQMITADGTSKRNRKKAGGSVSFEQAKGGRYGICCPNNEEYLAFVFAQIDEILEYFEPDGLFFDMLYWPHACYCESCRKKWQEETGHAELPRSNNFDDPLWREFCAVRNRWMGEYAMKVTNYVRERAPHLSIEHNISAGAKEGYLGTGMAVNRASDFCGGDLAGGLLEESVVCKLYREISVNQPFEYMFPKCEPSLHLHTLVKTDEHISAAIFLAAAHHGATMVIDAIDPVGTMDIRSSEAIGRAFGKIIPYEKYFVGDPICDIGVAYGLDSKGKLRFGNTCNNHSATVGFIKNMIEGGISAGVICRDRDLSEYKMIFAPCLWETEDELVSALLKYAREGGVLYVSGAGNDAFIEEITGGKVVGMSETQPCYFAPVPEAEALFGNFNRDYPLPINARIPLLKFEDEVESINILARLNMPYTPPTGKKFASIHSNPPGLQSDIPVVIERPYGKGRVIYSAAPIEQEEYVTYQRIIRNFIDRHVGMENLTIRTDSPSDVETVAYRHENSVFISNTLLLDPKNPPSIPSFTVTLKCDSAPRSVKLLPDEKDIDFSYGGEHLTFLTRKTEMFDMYKIEF